MTQARYFELLEVMNLCGDARDAGYQGALESLDMLEDTALKGLDLTPDETKSLVIIKNRISVLRLGVSEDYAVKHLSELGVSANVIKREVSDPAARARQRVKGK